MTTRRQRRFTAEFKKRVAIETLRGDRTVQQIAARHEVHPNQVSLWKRQAVDRLEEVFADHGHERCMDNVFIERPWRSLKHKAVYLQELTDGFAAERVIGARQAVDRLEEVFADHGHERCMDNVFIERPWRSLKHEGCIFRS